MNTINGLPEEIHQIIDYLSTAFAAPEVSVLLAREDLYNDLVVLYLEIRQNVKLKPPIKNFIFISLKRKLINKYKGIINEKNAETKLQQNFKEIFSK